MVLARAMEHFAAIGDRADMPKSWGLAEVGRSASSLRASRRLISEVNAAAGFLVGLFMIQHDCGHGSFFRHRLANDCVGRVIGVLTLMLPYDWNPLQ